MVTKLKTPLQLWFGPPYKYNLYFFCQNVSRWFWAGAEVRDENQLFCKDTWSKIFAICWPDYDKLQASVLKDLWWEEGGVVHGSEWQLPPPPEGERNWEWQERILRPHCTGHQHIVCPTRALACTTLLLDMSLCKNICKWKLTLIEM